MRIVEIPNCGTYPALFFLDERSAAVRAGEVLRIVDPLEASAPLQVMEGVIPSGISRSPSSSIERS